MSGIPSVGRIVHYVSYGTPGGEYTSQCRAAIVAAVPEADTESVVVDLVVLNPAGLFFNRCAQFEPESPEDLPHLGGTWHWPERIADG